TIRHYPDELEFTISVDERLEFIEMIDKYKVQFIQDNHDDGSMTVRLVKTKVDDEAEDES
ncbi:unnamed protein product, partial [marine sediment metagenome]